MSKPARMTFVDTTVLVHAHDSTQRERRPIAQQVLANLWQTGTGALSTQVLLDFYTVTTGTIGRPLQPAVARTTVARYSTWHIVDTNPELIVSAARLADEHAIAFRSALILVAALLCDASLLLTEELPHGQRYGSLTVRNPFA